MANLRSTRKPVFLWQAGLILLPVLVIAVVAITAIIENRTAVERDARQRAEELARQYGKELERSWGGLLMWHEVYSRRWSDYLAKVVGGWPAGKPRAGSEAEASPSPATDLSAQLAEWQTQYPGFRAEEVFPAGFGLTAEGRFHDGSELDPAPQPPAWFTAFSPAQRAAWEAVKTAASSGGSLAEIEQLIARFQETGPGPDAELNAAFIAMRARLATLPPPEAVAEALRFAQTSSAALSEAGLPLSNLAFGEALRYARATGPSEDLWEAVPGQVLHAPSALIPPLLDQLESLAGANTTLQASVQAWRTLWHARLKLFDIAEALRQTGKLRGITTANLWIQEDQTRWLCVLNPAHTSKVSALNSAQVENTNDAWTEVRFLPKSVAELALVRALENSDMNLPGYLGLAARLEGEPLNLPERWAPGRATNSAPALLAEVTGTLSDPAKPPNGPSGPETGWEGLPSRPRFDLQLYLADPALLYASYRRHALLLAGLVAASAFAALIGVLASWRAFQSQLRLNDLKSNFVSSVSHELRSPIASVRLMAESLERGKVPEAQKQHEYFHFIVQECRRLSSLIENVLDFSRIEQGRKQYDLEPTDLVALTHQTVNLMETYAAERDVKLQLQLANAINHQLPHHQLLADGKALQQALVNLIDNALKHSPKGDTVTVGLELEMQKPERGENIQHPPAIQHPAPRITHHVSRFTFHAPRLLLWVEDHGQGIPPSEQEKIFERFYRRGSELRRQTQGVGIGLSIVKHIVEAHGGRVLVRSAVGQGSRFTIELPLSPTTAKPETQYLKPE
jgi:signal transduction histidine kinase